MKIRNATFIRGLTFVLAVLVLGNQKTWPIQQEQETARVISVDSDQTLADALTQLQDGDTLQIMPGRYRGGWQVQGIANLTVEAAQATKPPIFEGGNLAWQFSRCSHLTVRNLKAKGQRSNGFNIDDGGKRDQPVEGTTLENLEVSEVGPQGNHDGIKLSGLIQLKVLHCKISGWGGQAIDMVGCHQVAVERCELIGKDGFSQNSGIQCKGGSSQVVISQCFFRNAGQRPINAGGSTGLDYFRPVDARYEAKDITIQSCMFFGSPCACAFVGVDGAKFLGNRVNYPEKWIFRVLQESTDERFVPCRNILITDNRFIFHRDVVSTAVNVGPGTLPDTLQFRGNHWYAEDRPAASRLPLPVEETDGQYGVDPREVR